MKLTFLAVLLALTMTGWSGLGADGAASGPGYETCPLPGPNTDSGFAVLDASGRSSLLVLDNARRRLLVYPPGPAGYMPGPPRTLTLPSGVAWIAPLPPPGNTNGDLLISASEGLYQFHPDEAQGYRGQLVIASPQPFNYEPTYPLTHLPSNQVAIYHPAGVSFYTNDLTGHWQLMETQPLAETDGTSRVQSDDWMLGDQSGQQWFTSQLWRPGGVTNQAAPRAAANAPRKDLHHHNPRLQPGELSLDLQYPGSQDLVLWDLHGDLEMDCETVLQVFLRGRNGQLPTDPSQVVHARGFPIPIGSTDQIRPVADLRHDGQFALILVQLDQTVLSYEALLDILLSKGVDVKLTIRPFHNGQFARSPEGSVTFNLFAALEPLPQAPIVIPGDLTGDGLPDLLVQQNSTHWNLFPGRRDQNGFASRPVRSFDPPVKGTLAVQDLDGQGQATVIWQSRDQDALYLFRPPPATAHPAP